ncbi:MAG: DNA gyrase subunit A, partial [candidate division KSB1 bacterium]|nr:DNA gyrase subunit A [candidate division KSB1 bacterium]
GERVAGVVETSGEDEIVLVTAGGLAVRFSEQEVRDTGLAAGGMRGAALEDGDQVIALVRVARPNGFLVTITQRGYAKRTLLKEYALIHRGGKGVITHKISDKTGSIAAALEADEKTMLLVVSKNGKMKKVKASGIKVANRAAAGEAIIALTQKDVIAKLLIAPEESLKRA